MPFRRACLNSGCALAVLHCIGILRSCSCQICKLTLQAQSKTSMILMGNTLCGSLPAMLTVLFWGPLSDKWGRKPILLIAYAGAVAQIIIDFLTIHFGI